MEVKHIYDKTINQLKVAITLAPRKMAFQKRILIKDKDVFPIAEKILLSLKEKFEGIKLLSGGRIHNEGRLTGTWVFLIEKKETPKPVKKKPIVENTIKKPQEQRRKFEVDFDKNKKDS